MIEKRFLDELAIKWQTLQINVIREYVQHLFLSRFYKEEKAHYLCFKGGTALRLVMRSPRFSEDLDFSSTIHAIHTIENIVENVLLDLHRQNIPIDITEAKPTTDGYLFQAMTHLYERQIEIKLNIVMKDKAVGEATNVDSVFLPPYNLILLTRKELIREKITALITRKKPRDFFDVYFILRSFQERETVAQHREEIKKIVTTEQVDFDELKQFLPKSFWPIIKDLNKNIISELAGVR